MLDRHCTNFLCNTAKISATPFKVTAQAINTLFLRPQIGTWFKVTCTDLPTAFRSKVQLVSRIPELASAPFAMVTFRGAHAAHRVQESLIPSLPRVSVKSQINTHFHSLISLCSVYLSYRW